MSSGICVVCVRYRDESLETTLSRTVNRQGNMFRQAQGTPFTFQILYNSYFTYRHFIRLYIVIVTETASLDKQQT